jgi:hypothetical protein
MIEYMENLPDEERQQVTEVIRLLLRQTFLLERKYDKKTGRFLFNKEYRICSKHLEFLQEYFQIAGIELKENSPTGVMYLVGEDVLADKLTKLATIYLLVLKLIYDEQMSQASTSVNIYTTLGELNSRVGSFQLLKERPSATEIKRTMTLLKKYQIIEVPESIEELESESRLIIYPSINMVLFGDKVRELITSFEEETDGNEDE